MKTTTQNIFTLFFFLAITSIIFTSCTKEEDTVGIIKVVYTNGNPVIGATVVLDQSNGQPGTVAIEDLEKTKTTDANGRAEFVYEYEAILDISVTKTSGNDNYTGNSVIRLLRGKTTTITVEVSKIN